MTMTASIDQTPVARDLSNCGYWELEDFLSHVRSLGATTDGDWRAACPTSYWMARRRRLRLKVVSRLFSGVTEGAPKKVRHSVQASYDKDKLLKVLDSAGFKTINEWRKTLPRLYRRVAKRQPELLRAVRQILANRRQRAVKECRENGIAPENFRPVSKYTQWSVQDFVDHLRGLGVSSYGDFFKNHKSLYGVVLRHGVADAVAEALGWERVKRGRPRRQERPE